MNNAIHNIIQRLAAIVLLLFLCTPLRAQEEVRIQWLSFEQLEDSLSVNPKKVFIDFYTDWCTYCRKMDKLVFTNPKVIDQLNGEYYAVRFNAETEASISFGGQVLVNEQLGKSRTPLHQIAQLLALRQGEFTAPTIVVLNEEFSVTSRHFEYLDSKKILQVLQ
ncbi:MAG: thioredoxin fold domain-containing protein [Bacteroidota bacterium]